MRRWLLLGLSVALAVSVFAPVAPAQGDDGGFDDRGMHARGADDRGFDDRGMHVRGTDDKGFDDRGMNNRGIDDNAVASPASSASASTSAMSSASASASPTASPSASASASPSASPTASPTTTASATPVLPDTSGFPPAWVLGPLAMILGGGLMALGIVRRR
jgi:cell division septation protein DedD